MKSRPAESRLRGQNVGNRIDMLCDEFEDKLRSDESPRIEDQLLRVANDERAMLLVELLAIETEYRTKRGERIAIDEYVERMPDFANQIRDFFTPPTVEASFDARSELATVLSTSGNETTDATISLQSAVPASVIRAESHERRFSPGEFLIRQGEVGASLMFIRSGTVKIRVRDAAGAVHEIDRCGAGEVLGEMALLTDEPRTADAIAADNVVADVVPAEAYHRLARDYPRLAVALTNLLADRLGRDRRDALSDKQLGGYRIRRRLGRGGMGIVYEAEEMSTGRLVALKMMSHRLVYSPRGLQRFQQEADVVELFQHPHIVRMFGRFSAFHTYFIVLEFCSGETLAERLETTGSLGVDEFRRVLGQLADALHYAHCRQVVHRDLKPANIMLTNHGVKLMDFGLAEPLDLPRLEADTAIVGTPRYMAPEQRVAGSIGVEADLFALGCVAYEMLTRTPLFDGTVTEELTRRFDNWQAPRFEQLCPALSNRECELLSQLMRVDPSERRTDLSQIARWATTSGPKHFDD